MIGALGNTILISLELFSNAYTVKDSAQSNLTISLCNLSLYWVCTQLRSGFLARRVLSKTILPWSYPVRFLCQSVPFFSPFVLIHRCFRRLTRLREGGRRHCVKRKVLRWIFKQIFCFPRKKVLWVYYSFTLVFIEEIGTVKLWASTQCIFLIQNLSITSVTVVILKYMEVIL